MDEGTWLFTFCFARVQIHVKCTLFIINWVPSNKTKPKNKPTWCFLFIGEHDSWTVHNNNLYLWLYSVKCDQISYEQIYCIVFWLNILVEHHFICLKRLRVILEFCSFASNKYCPFTFCQIISKRQFIHDTVDTSPFALVHLYHK